MLGHSGLVFIYFAYRNLCNASCQGNRPQEESGYLIRYPSLKGFPLYCNIPGLFYYVWSVKNHNGLGLTP